MSINLLARIDDRPGRVLDLGLVSPAFLGLKLAAAALSLASSPWCWPVLRLIPLVGSPS